MKKPIRALEANAVPKGSMKVMTVGDKRIVIINVNGEFYAMDDTCTHAHCSLGEDGFLDGNVLMCGCHGGQFDAVNGKALAMPAVEDLKTYNVSTRSGMLYIRL